MDVIPYARQEISDEDVEAVVAALRSPWLTQGPAVDAFEAAVARHVGAGEGVAVSNGTAALHLACLALGLGPGDRLWTTPITFAASANCALYCGAEVDFVDIDPVTWNLSVDALAAKLAAAERAGRLPKILVPVHFTGRPCDMPAIGELARRYGVRVLEDASHALGATLGDERIGECRHSDAAVFSTHAVKIVATAEGGLVVTRDPEIAERVRLLRSHGITRDPARMEQRRSAWYYEQVELGFNYRMTCLQAALGSSQMRRVDGFLQGRRALARRYRERLQGLPLGLPLPDAGPSCSAWHLYVVRIDPAAWGASRDEVFDAMRAAGIGVNVHYIPVPAHPYYRRRGFAPDDFPEARRFGDEALTLPLFVGLTDGDQDRVLTALEATRGR